LAMGGGNRRYADYTGGRLAVSKTKRTSDIFNLSFLDVITCAFGAMIMLLLITPKIDEKAGNSETAKQQLAALAAEEKKIETLSGQLAQLTQGLQSRMDNGNRLRKLQSKALARLEAAQQASARVRQDKKGLELVRQSLTTTLKLKDNAGRTDVEVGGIPVNSDYVIFIIDTSGSMSLIWPHVMREIENVLSIHPRVRGFQIMSDNGDYLMDGFARLWIPDSPTMRNSAIKLMRYWNTYSNSSPVEGLEKAIRVYGHSGEKISIYIFGDDYTGNSFDGVINTLEKLNTNSTTGEPLVKIHGIGFMHPGGIDPRLVTERKFSILMREVARRNGGAFIALPIK